MTGRKDGREIATRASAADAAAQAGLEALAPGDDVWGDGDGEPWLVRATIHYRMDDNKRPSVRLERAAERSGSPTRKSYTTRIPTFASQG
jgi:hypothetical protein